MTTTAPHRDAPPAPAGASAAPSAGAATDALAPPPGARTRPFEPARWLRGAHLQTIVPSLLRWAPRHPTRRERLELADGDFIDLDVVLPEGPPRGVLLAVHGLEGSSQAPYILGTIDVARRRGLVAVALNQRGCSGEPNRLASSYHSGLTSDIRAVAAWIAERWPGLPGAVMGFSLGANQTLKMLGEAPGEAPAPFVAACAVSPPFDIDQVARRLDSREGALYRLHFLRTLVPKALAKARRFPDAVAPVTVLAAARRASLRAYDDAVTAPLHGYRDAADYYARASSGRYVEAIRLPTLILTSADDPIIPGATIPRGALAEHPAVRIHAMPQGGHVGFVYGSPWRPRYWAEEQGVLWLARRMREAAR